MSAIIPVTTPLSQQHLLDTLASQLDHVIASDQLDLPPAPNLLTQISDFANNTDSNIQHIVDILSAHPDVCQRLLVMANSPSLGARVEIKTIPLAVMRLGLSNLQVLASSAVISHYLENLKLQDLLPYYRRVWQRSIKVAAISYVFALHHHENQTEKALLAGLIHNIGVMPILKYIAALPELQDKPLLMSTLADQVIPKHYVTIGTRLLANWQVDPELIRITYSHQKNYADNPHQNALDDIVFIAYQLSLLVDYCDPESPPDSLINSPAFAKIWPDWRTATDDLINYTGKIKQIQKDISKS